MERGTEVRCFLYPICHFLTAYSFFIYNLYLYGLILSSYMKKLFYLVAGLCIMYTASVQAAPGDTTWVQANINQLSGFGSYDTAVTFPAPGTTYRKIYMIFTLGKYMCGGSGYCGDWDYTVLNYLMTPGGDTLEIARLITPYANAGAPRTPWTWQQHYVFDVTDYANLLRGAATMRIFYSGYSPGFTANVRFAFIEGTPDRNVLGVTRLWNGSFGYGGTPAIDTHFLAKTETPPTGTQTSDLKFLVTGHGSDANGCCEFMSHNYQVMLNSSSVATKTIWRSDCGMNELSPQSGTWLYERANWCPGALVYWNYHDLPGLAAGTPFNVALQFDPYTGGGSYTTEAHMVYYGGMNKTLDASLDQIISPTKDENHFRENPNCGHPVIHVKNTGSTAITSIGVRYGITDSVKRDYTWTGSLASLQETDITLPNIDQLNNIAGVAGTFNFIASITSVNGVADDDSTNNNMTTQFATVPVWPDSLIINMKTNNEHLTSSSTTSETSWAIYDMNDSIVAQHVNATINTIYKDTIRLLPFGYYKLVLYDSSCDGLHWWVWDANPSAGINAGYFYVRRLNYTTIPMNGYQYGGTYANDFGCGFTQYFSTGIFVDHTAIRNVSEENVALEAYPNPAQDVVNIVLSGMTEVRGRVSVYDALGRVVHSDRINDASFRMNVSNLSTGMYTIVFNDELQQGRRLTTRLMITK